MVATADSPLVLEIGEMNDYLMAASATIYEGSLVGDNGSGYARALVAGDPFLGHAYRQVIESTGSAGGATVKVRSGRYRAQVTISAIAITDVGKDVYGSADDTLTLTVGSNSFVGTVVRYVTTNTCVVEFQPQMANIPNHEHTATSDGGKLTSPRIITGINDTNGNELIKVTATGSAVNEITLGNAATGNVVTITASGGDTNVGITIDCKGAGALQLGSGDVLIGFYGTTPVVQASHIANTSGDDATGVNAILVVLENLGLVKSS